MIHHYKVRRRAVGMFRQYRLTCNPDLVQQMPDHEVKTGIREITCPDCIRALISQEEEKLAMLRTNLLSPEKLPQAGYLGNVNGPGCEPDTV